MKIKIGGKTYTVEVAETDKEKEEGLQKTHYLPEDEGMLFIYEEADTVGFWMKDTYLPLDIIFINEDFEVISVFKGEPESEEISQEDDVQFVLELNIDSGVKIGDELEFIEEGKPRSKMLVLNEDGKTQLELDGGERIFSRKNTKILIKQASRAYKSKKDAHYKILGKSVFKYIKAQDGRDPEHVELKND